MAFNINLQILPIFKNGPEESYRKPQVASFSPEIEASKETQQSYSTLYPKHGWYATFPTFTNNIQINQYRLWQRKNISFNCILLLLSTIAIPSMATRFSWYLFGSSQQNPWGLTAQLILVPCLMVIVVHLYAYYYWKKYPTTSHYAQQPEKRSFLQWCEWLVSEGQLEECIMYTTVFANACIFISRVSSGACPGRDNSIIWLSQSCNPEVECHSFPHDATLMLFLPTMCLHFIWRGVRFTSVLIGYMIGIAVLVYAIIAVDKGYIQIYTLLYAFVFPAISYEMERFMRMSFINHMMLAEVFSDNMSKIESEQMRAIVGNMAHDLKTPLHSITAEIDCLRLYTSKLSIDMKDHYNGAPVEGITSAIQPILKQFFTNSNAVYDHLDGMTQFLLMAINRSQDFVKAKSGVAIMPSLETIDILRTAELVKKIIDNQGNGRQVIIHPIDASELCPTIITDHQFFLDNLLCLVSNACKFSDKGAVVGITMKLVSDNTFIFNNNNLQKFESFWIDSPTANKKVFVSVEDNGIGISAEDQKNLFEPFRQAQRRTGGTGLGLYSLKKRMQALHGDCGVKARKDGKQGSVFWFSFPYRPDIHYMNNIPSVSAMSTDSMLSNFKSNLDDDINNSTAILTHPPLNQTIDVSCESPMIPIPMLRILLTDDSPSILKVTSRFLKMNGHEVTTAENGSEALKLINNDELIFDVLVTDLQMPIMDGFECVRRLRAKEKEMDVEGGCMRLFVIGMSANSDDETKREALAVGMDAFCPKPFKYRDFELIIESNRDLFLITGN